MSDDNVIQFRSSAMDNKVEELIWKCDCGNSSFLIYASWALECADCGCMASGVNEHYQTLRRWVRKAEEKTDE